MSAAPILLNNIEETLSLGRRIGNIAEAGSVIALCGGLGAGKTHLTKGIVEGLECASEVTSPTFTLVHEYRGGRLPLFHFDFYRMNSADEVLGLGWDEYLESDGVCVVEWADLFPNLLPNGTQWWQLTPDENGGRAARLLDGSPA